MLLPALIAAVVSGIALRLLGRTGGLPFDRPNVRSLHRDIVPRGGGLAIWLGWCAGIVWLPGAQPWLFPLAAIVIVSFFDDRRGIPAPLRLFVQLAAAIAWLWLAAPMPDLIVAATMAVAIVWVANLYNFMDGSDGLAGTMTVVGFGAYALAAFWAGSDRAPTLLALAAATLPFLLVNWPPARIFLGDVGSVPLGFLAAVFGIEGWRQGWWPLWFPLLVFLPFIADASSTLLRRLLRRRAGLAGAPRPLLPAAGATGRGPRRHAGALCCADDRRGGIGAGGAWLARRRPAGTCWPSGSRSWRCCSARLSIIGAIESVDCVTVSANWRALLAFAHDVVRGGDRVDRAVLAALQSRPARAPARPT